MIISLAPLRNPRNRNLATLFTHNNGPEGSPANRKDALKFTLKLAH